MKLLCKMLGGSHSYGLNTAASDIDYRGVFLNTEVKYLIGLDKHEHQQSQTEQTDEVYTEFRNALKLLRGANTQMVELLFNNNWIEISPEWETVVRNRERLVSSEKLFACLRGYMQGELRLANGERTGKLGGKRKASIDRFGYSPKNFVQLFRLAWAGQIYFEENLFPVNVMEKNSNFGKFLLDVKTQPEKYTREELNNIAKTSEFTLEHSFKKRLVNNVFNEPLANRLCLRAYAPLITEAYQNL